MPKSAAEIERGVKHLSKSDPVLKAVIRRAGPFTLKLRRDRFQSLVLSIISQQISTKAARAIRERLIAHVGEAGMTPQHLSALTMKELRSEIGRAHV